MLPTPTQNNERTYTVMQKAVVKIERIRHRSGCAVRDVMQIKVFAAHKWLERKLESQVSVTMNTKTLSDVIVPRLVGRNSPPFAAAIKLGITSLRIQQMHIKTVLKLSAISGSSEGSPRRT